MRKRTLLFLSALPLLTLTACIQPPQPPAPPDTITQGMAGALIDTGFFRDVTITRTIGRHYNPAENRWTILACYEFTRAGDAEGRSGAACVDSFTAFRLDNGTWVATVTVNGEYRWRALGVSLEAETPEGM